MIECKPPSDLVITVPPEAWLAGFGVVIFVILFSFALVWAINRLDP